MADRKRVLFICVGNSARSQIAQGLLEKIGGGDFDVYSGGSHPSPRVHPLAIEVMKNEGIDISDYEPKPCTKYKRENFDFVISLCEDKTKNCPVGLLDAVLLQWRVPDPAAYKGEKKGDKKAFFRRTMENLKDRIEEFVAVQIPPEWRNKTKEQKTDDLQEMHDLKLDKEITKLFGKGGAIGGDEFSFGLLLYLMMRLKFATAWKVITAIVLVIGVIASSSFKLGAGSWPWQ